MAGMRTAYCAALAAFLLLSALFHMAAPLLTERWMSNPPMVRLIGFMLVLFSIPGAFWGGWYFWTLCVALAVSGIWRLFFPASSINAQRWSYPRWVHGCLLLLGAALIWAFKS